MSITGQFVTVKFEVNAAPFTLPNVTVPTLTFEYIRYPIQVGDKGAVLPFDVLMGAISGMGAATPPTFLPPANLGALCFLPVSNKGWTATDDPDAVVIYGPNGFVLRDVGKNCSIVGDQENITTTAKTMLVLKVGANATITIKDGEIDITATTVKINGKVWEAHEHSGVATGTGNSGGVVP